MAVQASKIISLTVTTTGGTMQLSANKIVKFLASGASTLISYLNNQDKMIQKLVDETLAAINTAAARTQAVTLVDGTIIYIDSDKIITIDDDAAGSAILYWNPGVAAPEVIIVTEAAAAISVAAGNLLSVVTQTGAFTRYINNLFVAQIDSYGTGAQIKYDNKKSAYTILYVTATPAALKATINAL